MTEPTQPADYSRYESTQTGIPPIPPPPPNTRRPWWHVAVPALMIVALIALILIPNVVLSKQPVHTHIDPGATEAAQVGATQRAADTATASVPTPTPTLAPTPTPTKNISYTAATIMQDFTANGLPTSQINYTMTLNKYLDSYSDLNNPYSNVQPSENSVTTMPTSYVFFIDPENTAGTHGPNCDANEWLGVFSSVGDAQNSSAEIASYDGRYSGNDCPLPYNALQYGRCVLVTYTSPTSGYAQVVKADCV
jgi:hypothetical protein